MHRVMLAGALLAVVLVHAPAYEAACAQGPALEAGDASLVRPAVDGTLRLHARRQEETAPKSGVFRVVERDLDWKAAETAIIICDMWEDHPCQMSAHRVDVMAPQVNRVISAARSLGVQIIHAPSDGMPHYAQTPERARLQRAPPVKPPFKLEAWCHLDPEREAEYPIPYTTTIKDGCDDPVYRGDYPSSRRQHAAIKIVGYDGVSDKADEIYNFFEQVGIKNVVLMGVHTHYCVLGRAFGIRQMVKLGKNVVLCRDLTDAMYDPHKPPYVSHARGTELAIEHIEKYWCASIESDDLMKVVADGGEAASRQNR